MKFYTRQIFLICSSGGHLTQMLRLNSALDDYKVTLITEKTVISKVLKQTNLDKILFLPHGGREDIFKYLFKFTLNIILSFYRYIRYRPKTIISTGAHTALPTCYIAKLFGSRVIFIETFAKISTPSLTGRAVYPIADVFYVQWPELKSYYPKAKYMGKLY